MLRSLVLFPMFPCRNAVSRSLAVALCVLLAGPLVPHLLALTPTVTTMSVSSPTLKAEQPVTLTATVTANGSAVNPGQVVFCNALAPHCEDLAILGLAQLKTDGTASIKILLSAGNHSIYAKFLGTRGTASTSASGVTKVSVTGGQNPTDAQIFTTGTAANRTLAAKLDFGAVPGSSSVSFRDVTNHNVIASARLDASTSQFSLAPSQEYLTGDQFVYGYYGLVVADFNNDGIPDVLQPVVLDPPYNNHDGSPTAISVLPGDPSHPGHLLPEVNSEALGQAPQGYAVADFNGDGVLDVALVDNGISGVIVCLGDPAHPGKFLPPQTYASGNQYYNFGVIQGDFNGDGLPDLALSNNGDFTSVGTFSVLLNDPAHPGQFLAPQIYSAGVPAYPGGLVTADFDGDGILDLAISGSTGPGPSATGVVAVFRGDPSNPGKFLPPLVSAAGPYAPRIEVGDFNGDGVPDLVFLTTDVGVALGDKTHPGTFLLPQSPAPFGATGGIAGLSTGDFNGDGNLDIAVTFFDSNGPGVSAVELFTGDPAHPGQLLAGLPYVFGPEVGGIVAADLNGDGLSDVASGGGDNNGGYVQVRLGQRTETATAYHFNSGNTSYAYATYDGDSNYGPVSSCEIPLDMTAAYPTIINPTVTNITKTSATISWTSNVKTYGTVEYQVYGLQNSTQPSVTTESTPWDPSESTMHSFTLSNLTPGNEYPYTIWAQSYFSGCNHYTASSTGYIYTAVP
jgi:hypothetical protein